MAVLLACGCSTPKLPPGVVEPPLGETATTIEGPMPGFGPFDNVVDAIMAACPVIMGQPHAIIPVPEWDQNFRTYWRTAREYCAWFYSPDNRHVEMSLLAVSAVQDDPAKRKCSLPPQVLDRRYPPTSLAYLVIAHGHPMPARMEDGDLYFLAEMAELHGATARLNGKDISISVVAYFGRERNGTVECGGFYHYVPLLGNEMFKYTINERGELKSEVVARVTWTPNGLVHIESVHE